MTWRKSEPSNTLVLSFQPNWVIGQTWSGRWQEAQRVSSYKYRVYSGEMKQLPFLKVSHSINYFAKQQININDDDDDVTSGQN